MRAVLQRVSAAQVIVAGATVGSIGQGIVALVGVATGDVEADAQYIADKISELRLFDGIDNGSERSLMEINGSALVISQFTLMGDCRKGRRPSWSAAARPEEAQRLYEVVIARLRDRQIHTETGRFRTEMNVTLTNDGPFTVLIDSRKEF
jgi:D-tyrosyl-tRNA(Tyr) deacylase